MIAICGENFYTYMGTNQQKLSVSNVPSCFVLMSIFSKWDLGTMNPKSNWLHHCHHIRVFRGSSEFWTKPWHIGFCQEELWRLDFLTL